MAWKDELAALLADVATSAPGRAAGDVLGSAPAQAVLTALNLPLSGVKYGTGALIGGINEGLGLLPGQHGYEPGTSAALHRGGPRAAFEQVRSEEPLWVQAPTEALLDPLTWVGGGAAGKVAKTLRERQILEAAAEHAVKAKALGGVARGYETVQTAVDLPGRALGGVQKGVTKAVSPLRTAEGTGLLDLSPKAALRQDMDNVYTALSDARASGVRVPHGIQQLGLPSLQQEGLPGMPSLFPATSPTQRFSLANTQIFEHPGLTREQNGLMARTLEDGTTYGQFLDEHSLAAATDLKQLRADGVEWKPTQNSLDDWLRATKGTLNQGDNEKIVRTWHKYNTDLLNTGSPEDVAAKMLEDRLKTERGIQESGRSYLRSLLMSVWGETALFSGKYQSSNIQGNVLMSAVQGNLTWAHVNYKNFVRNFKIYNAGTNYLERDRLIEGLMSTQVSTKWGLEAGPAQLFNVGGIQSAIGGQYESAVGELAGQVTKKITGSEKLSGRVGNTVGKPLVWNNRMSLGFDLVPRDAIYSDVFDLAMMDGLPGWESKVRDFIPGGDFAALDHPSAPGSFAAGPLQAHLESLGIKSGDATRLTRDFTEMRGLARKAALDEMGKTQFTYLRTNLDEQVARFVPFHYWYSRALRFWGEAAVRNPQLVLNYMRANQGIEDAQHDPGLSARQKGFLKLMGTPMGFSLLMNPDSLFGVVKIFDMHNPEPPVANPDATWSDPPEGMTPLGGALDWMKRKGVGAYPWIDGMVNMLGVYGNTFEPDLLGIRHRALVGSVVNFAMAEAGAHPPGTPYADAMGQARWVLSSTAASFLPGWIAQPVLPKAGGSTQQASLETIIENIVTTDNPGITGEDLLMAMSNPDSPEYKAAYQKAASAGVVQQLLNFMLPMQFQLRNDAKDVRAAQKTTIEDATPAGQSAFTFTPTIGDVQFAADYQRLTGNPWKPGDYQDASFKTDLARAPSGDAKRFVYENAAYHDLGTASQQKAFETYKALKYGDDPRTAGMDPAAADQLANAWLDASGQAKGIDAIYAQREIFSANHPAYRGFLDWQTKMREVQRMYGGLAEYRRRASMESPNAARYFAEREAYLRRTEPDPEKFAQRLEDETISAAAYQATIGQGAYRSQPGGVPGAPRYDTALPGMLPAAPPSGAYNPQENWMAQLAAYGRSQGINQPRR